MFEEARAALGIIVFCGGLITLAGIIEKIVLWLEGKEDDT